MYRCTECGHLFDEPKRYSMDRTPGFSSEPSFYETMYSCPYCNNGDVAYEEVKLCPLCEENYIPVDSHGHVDTCSDCKQSILKRYSKVILDNFREDEYDILYDLTDGLSYEDLRKEI